MLAISSGAMCARKTDGNPSTLTSLTTAGCMRSIEAATKNVRTFCAGSSFVPTICITDRKEVLGKMCLYWGIVPVLIESLLDKQELRKFVDEWAKTNGGAEEGDPIVIVSDTELLPGVHDTVMVTRIS